MKILSETEVLILGHENEQVWLKDKESGSILFEYSFYGDPQCGLIDEENCWAIIAGEYLIIWKAGEKGIIVKKEIKWVHSLRFKDKSTVEILTDPWSENSSIWEVDINTAEHIKIKDFNDYKGREYTEDVVW